MRSRCCRRLSQQTNRRQGMPKALAKPPPSSSVARFLDLSAAARAVAVNNNAIDSVAAPDAHAREPIETAASVQHAPSIKKKDQPKREVVLTLETDEVFSRLVELYRRMTGTKLTTSHVARAILKGAHHCMPYLEREARHIGPMNLPSNARGRELERERFEARLADAFIAGMRSAPAMDREP